MVDDLWIHFSVSGVETWFWLPPLVAFCISFFTSMVGVSGAFLLLPFQMSVLGFTSPAVSATNLVYNLVAIPGGVYRFIREGRMLWPLTAVIVIGSTPGIALGYFIRTRYLPDPQSFRLFAGVVLLYLGYRLVQRLIRSRHGAPTQQHSRHRPKPEPPVTGRLDNLHLSLRESSFEYAGRRYGFRSSSMFLLALVVGIIGGVYGIGGGAFIAPFCVSLFRLPVHSIAGATLAATLLTSIVGVVFYQWLPAPSGLAVRPDWGLGALFGLGGLVGGYLGARAQRFVPQRWLEFLLGALLLGLGLKYLIGSV